MLACMSAGDTVVLAHGMGRTRASMLLLAKYLRGQHYRVELFGYAVRGIELDAITHQFLAFVRASMAHHDRAAYHLIGHSLGNIIARNAFRFGYPAGLGRMVMLGPPNAPAKLAIDLNNHTVLSPLFKSMTGDSGQKLADPAFYATLPVPPVPFGIIAGTSGQRLTFDEPNDSIVTVSSTKLEGMADWLEVPNIHGMIANAAVTHRQCVHFIEHGCFAVSDG